MKLVVIVAASLAVVAGTRSQPRVEEEDAVSLPFLKDLPRPWVLEQVPPPGRSTKKEPTTRPPLLKEAPQYYYPYYYVPLSFQKYRTKDGVGVAVHPGGATSFVSPQVHGVGKRSAKPSVVVRRSPVPVPVLPPYMYDPWRYPYYPPYRPLVLRTPPFPPRNFVYHKQTHKQAPLTSEHGYSYGW
ncbi:uncharacterized protein LOC135111424 [Scylla paramamosain]|uniref:uncharacterized protein LOC135111424 n=1 Tax=Scylla paramamosain TaxID=85552 RepID=UPI00308355B2